MCAFDSLATYISIYKKFELRLTGRAKACSISGSVVIAENWGVYAKLIYKYQILYLDYKR